MKPGTIIKPGDYVQQSELDECRRENRELLARIRKLEGLKSVIIGLLMSADCTWEERNEGHDWPEAVQFARQALADLKGVNQ